LRAWGLKQPAYLRLILEGLGDEAPGDPTPVLL